jgi:predicted NBD/HSP70 family sugar kinase
MKLWGIDLGGTKIECTVLDTERSLEVMCRKRVATGASNGYAHILSQVKKLITEVTDEIGERPSQLGFATPGTLEPGTGLMKNCNTVCMNGQPMKADLEALLNTPVKIANDANCFALAETLMGAGKNYPEAEVVFGVIMGTGVGGGLVVHKKVVNGLHGLGGEWGHNILEEGGEDCYCGKKGCVEKVISGPGLERYYRSISNSERDLVQIVKNYHEGNDPHALSTMDRLCHYYGRAISTIINVIDPHLIIIGGGLGNIDLLYTRGFEAIKQFIFNAGIVNTPVCKPLLGDSAGVFGAALLWNDRLASNI